MDRCTISLIIPTLNAGKQLQNLIEAVKKQTRKPDEILIVDSSSDDGSLDFLEEYDRDSIKCIRIKKEEFDHGRTRDYALRQTNGDFIIFMTQDALPYDDYAFEHLIKQIKSKERIAAVGGRQIAYPSAKREEKLIRAFNYPDKTFLWNKEDILHLGIKAFLISDVFAVYRRSSYLDVGGFDYPIHTNEDMLIASKFLNHGYSLAYSADAIVYHSHDYTLREEYIRNKKIGLTLERYKEKFSNVSEVGRGFDLVFFVSRNLLKRLHIISFISFGLNCCARFLGNRQGRKIVRRLEHGKS